MAIKTLIKILTTNEIDSFFGCPMFNDKEQNDYFTLSTAEQERAVALSANTTWYFILQLGYFKARKQFFAIKDLAASSKDIEFITRLYKSPYPTKIVSEETHLKIRNLILAISDHSGDIKSNLDLLEQKAKIITPTTTNPKLIFKALYEHAANSRFLIPQYSTFQKIIGQALKTEAERLQNIIKRYLSNKDVNLLQQLLATTEQYYEITLIKQDQKNFRYAQVQNTIEKKTKYNELYKSAKKIISKLGITQSMIDYYATMINHYPVIKLKKLYEYTAYLYLLCYIYRRMQKINDNLRGSFDYYVDRYTKLSKEYGRQCVYETKSTLNKNVTKKLPKLLQLFLDNDIPDHEVRLLGLKIIPEAELKEVIAYITKSYVDEHSYRWQYFTNKKHKMIKNLRPIFQAIDFTCSPTCANLDHAITFLKTQFDQDEPLSQADKSDFPVDFIPKRIRPYMNNLDHAQYEFCVYDQIRKQFRNNEVTIQDSNIYGCN